MNDLSIRKTMAINMLASGFKRVRQSPDILSLENNDNYLFGLIHGFEIGGLITTQQEAKLIKAKLLAWEKRFRELNEKEKAGCKVQSQAS